MSKRVLALFTFFQKERTAHRTTRIGPEGWHNPSRYHEVPDFLPEIPPRQVVITCTRTHSGPALIRTNYHIPVDQVYIQQLSLKLTDVASDAVTAAKPAKIGWGMGTAQIGFNRRVCWADGTHSMHGNTRRPDFAGMEGPEDPAHLAIFAVDEAGKPIAVVYHNTSHPTNFYGAGLFSADYPDAARRIIRSELGRIPVLPARRSSFRPHNPQKTLGNPVRLSKSANGGLTDSNWGYRNFPLNCVAVIMEGFGFTLCMRLLDVRPETRNNRR